MEGMEWKWKTAHGRGRSGAGRNEAWRGVEPGTFRDSSERQTQRRPRTTNYDNWVYENPIQSTTLRYFSSHKPTGIDDIVYSSETGRDQ